MPLKIIRHDIIKVKADAIVNPADSHPVYGRGTDCAVYQAAGEKQLLESRRKLGDIAPGQAAATPGFRLPAKYIIHTVCAPWAEGQEGECEILRSCYDHCLQEAQKLRLKSIAFPLLAAGSLGFPQETALFIALDSFRSFLETEEMLIYLVVFDQQSVQVSKALHLEIEHYIDEHYVTEKKRLEYNCSSDSVFQASPRPNAPSASGQMAPEYESYSRMSQASQLRNIVLDKKPPKRTLTEAILHLGETFQERLLRLIDERGLSDVEVYKRANLNRKLFSKIRCNSRYKPSKGTVLALSIALKLNLDETKDLLGRAELALSPSNLSDLIIEYFIANEIYDIYVINAALFQYGQPLLGE